MAFSIRPHFYSDRIVQDSDLVPIYTPVWFCMFNCYIYIVSLNALKNMVYRREFLCRRCYRMILPHILFLSIVKALHSVEPSSYILYILPCHILYILPIIAISLFISYNSYHEQTVKKQSDDPAGNVHLGNGIPCSEERRPYRRVHLQRDQVPDRRHVPAACYLCARQVP